jgi:coproporphyrinogen III oxidase
MNREPNIPAVRRYLLDLQERIVTALSEFDGDSFRTDAWERPVDDRLRGDGYSCVIEDGQFFERGGVNFSHVRGDALPASAVAGRPTLAGRPFEALGVSLVLHPRNPYCPTVHMNVRVSNTSQPGGTPGYWFGGGMDLTPYYGFESDARHFHQQCHDAVVPFGDDLYRRFKLWCDDYFFLKHRQESRGIGGIFYDDFSELGFERGLAMTTSVGEAFLPAYLPIISGRRTLPYGERERQFQLYRRGRYVEFNLLHNCGTLFGLQSDGRIEFILMSMPPVAAWRYGWRPEPGSPEAHLLTHFLVPRDWLPVTASESVAHGSMP